MASKIVVGYDGSTSARSALDFALNVARAQGGSIVVAHVLEWSPYSFLSAEELAERHKRRSEELERAEQALIKPLLKDMETSGVDVTAEVKYGNIAEVLVKIAKSENADLIVIGRTGHSALSSRLFGSVAGTLAQAAPVPVTIVP
ncbi:universal stress protein [Phaeobacter italicus]|jgi:nucleotide-binding universal stress UspA family protein|uniref:Putative universal stress protein n=1 Tax=Phaeobacter italicus TaxID=481446 RepID=A0A0H5DIW2_9RHOB|nr:universal stress protein [Phaeobacter italicus]EEB72369.1 universal stress protein family protein [Ruegeria sp. R11]MEC8014817.1 universal stress protein [Pseudomonadota bacterium]NKX42281.1 universal stress protein [Rhodobacteraceae bacterium R_SAG2]NKX71761.1 universal stress protein [Rhodobacteraceae bacterium R_SAG1]MBO9443940.1 universal stress protein [Phaeobacter italicus]